MEQQQMAKKKTVGSGLSDAEKRKAVAKVLSGKALAPEVAREVGVTAQAVLNWIRDGRKRYGGDPEWIPASHISDELRRKAVALVMAGRPLGEAADECGVSRSSLTSWVRDPQYGGSEHFFRSASHSGLLKAEAPAPSNGAHPEPSYLVDHSSYIVDHSQPPPEAPLPLPTIAIPKPQPRKRGRVLTVKCAHCKGEHEICLGWLVELEGGLR